MQNLKSIITIIVIVLVIIVILAFISNQRRTRPSSESKDCDRVLVGAFAPTAVKERTYPKTAVFGGHSKSKTQVIKYGHEEIDPKATTVIFDRLDWKVYYPNGNSKGTFIDKCGVYHLPECTKEGKRILFYNHHGATNILMHPDPFGTYPSPPNAPATNAEFMHIVMSGHDQVVELEWNNWNHGWTIIRNEGGSHGGKAHVMGIKFHAADYLYTICTMRRMPGAGGGPNPAYGSTPPRDFVATIDINPSHVEYGQIVHIALGSEDSVYNPNWAAFNPFDYDNNFGNDESMEYHHGDLAEIDGMMYFIAPSLNYRNGALDFFNLTSQKAPVLSSYLTKEETQAAGVSAFHTTHLNRQTGNLIVSHLGSDGDDGYGPGGFVEISPNIGVPKLYGQPNPVTIAKYFALPAPGSATTLGSPEDRYNYDFTMDSCNNELVCTSWAPPASFDNGFDVTLASPYGRAIRIFKMPSEGTNEPPVSNMLIPLKVFVTDPTPELGGPSNGEGVVPLEVRRVHMPGQRIYFVGVTLPGAIDLIYFDEGDNDWHKKVVVTPTQIRSACNNASVLSNSSPSPSVPVYDLQTSGVGPADLGEVPLITDITLSMDDQFLYVSCWLAGALLQFDVSDPHNPVFVGGVGNLGGVRGTLSTGLLFNTGSHTFDGGNKLFAGGPQMLRLDPSGTDLYVTNSLYSSWDTEFYRSTVGNPTDGSIEDNGGMLIKLKTNVKQGERQGPMYIDTDFADNGVISFANLTHPAVSEPFTSRCHESHIMGVTH